MDINSHRYVNNVKNVGRRRYCNIYWSIELYHQVIQQPIEQQRGHFSMQKKPCFGRLGDCQFKKSLPPLDKFIFLLFKVQYLDMHNAMHYTNTISVSLCNEQDAISNLGQLNWQLLPSTSYDQSLIISALQFGNLT